MRKHIGKVEAVVVNGRVIRVAISTRTIFGRKTRHMCDCKLCRAALLAALKI